MRNVSCIFIYMRNTKEIWRDIKDYEGLYQVSNKGRVRSIKDKNHIYIIEGSITEYGYRNVRLCKDCVKKAFRVGRLVGFAFPEICGEYFDGAQINHKNENKLDNRAENLEWCTQKYNLNYGNRRHKAWLTYMNKYVWD